MVLYGLKWIEAKNQESKTINDKSAGGYLVLTQIQLEIGLEWRRDAALKQRTGGNFE